MKLDISISTVSRALRGVSDINPETKAQVLALAKELNYRPNPFASSLIKNRSNIIGLIIPSVTESFFANFIRGVQELTFETPYNVFIVNTNDDIVREQIDVDNFLYQRVDGIIMAPCLTADTTQHLMEIIRSDVPLVFFDRFHEAIPASRVVVDDFAGAFNAVEHLVEQGCRRIAHLGGASNLPLAIDRFEGYKAALRKHNLPFKQEYYLQTGYGYDDGQAGALQLMGLSEVPDSIFCVSDRTAIGAMLEFKRCGYKVPEDIAFLGFTDDGTANIVEPSLSTVRQPAMQMGRTASEILLNHLIEKQDGGKWVPKTQVISTELIVRGSSLRRA